MRDRLPLLALSFALLIGVVGLLFARSAARGEFAEPLSTYRSEPDGARALFLVAQRLGLKPERRQLDFEELDGTPELVLLGVEGDPPEPEEADGGETPSRWHRERLGEQESRSVIRAVERGATLVYAVGRAHPLLESLDVEFEPLEDATPRDLVPLSPTPFTQGVARVHTSVAGHLDAPGALPLLIDPDEDGAPVAVLLNRGAGRIVVLSAPALASNRRLLEEDNATFLIQTLRELQTPGGPLAFDEYHHGFAGERSVMGYAARFGLPWVVLQGIFALGLWSASRRRLGPPLPLLERDPQAGGDFLQAMARLYQRGHHRGHAADLMVRGVLRPLRQLARLPAHVPADQVVAALRSRGRDEVATSLEALLQRARAEPDDRQLLELSHAAYRLREQAHAARTLDPTP